MKLNCKASLIIHYCESATVVSSDYFDQHELVAGGVLLHGFAELLQRGRQFLRFVQYAGKQIANALKSSENVGNMELRRLQSGHNLFPLERRGYRSARMCAQH